MQLANKVIVVTGAGSGIGRELSLQLLKRGAQVAGVDRNPEAMQETRELAGVGTDRMAEYVLNVADRAGCNDLPDKVIAHFGHVDGIINNAGIIQPFKPVADLTDAEIERVLNVNFFGTLYLTRAFLPYLLERPAAHITNISSMGGFLPVPGQTIYGSAKAAVKLFTEGLHSELADTNVRVTVVFPGAIATNISTNSGLIQKKPPKDSPIKPLSAENAAAQILEAIEKDRFRATVGSDARMLDLLYRFRPEYAARFIRKKMKSLLAPDVP